MPPSPVQLKGKKFGYGNPLICVPCEQKRRLKGEQPHIRLNATCKHYWRCLNPMHRQAGIEWTNLLDEFGKGKCDHPQCNWFYDAEKCFTTDIKGNVVHPSGRIRVILVINNAGEVERHGLNITHEPRLLGKHRRPSNPGEDPWKGRRNAWPIFEMEGRFLEAEDGCSYERFAGIRDVRVVMRLATQFAPPVQTSEQTAQPSAQ